MNPESRIDHAPALPGPRRHDPAKPGEFASLDPRRGGNLKQGWGGRHSWSQARWHSLGAKPYPPAFAQFDDDIPALIREWILPGHAPEAGLLTVDDLVVTLGSCFARELRKHLERIGCSSGQLRVRSGLNNTFALLDFISWCVTGQDTGRGYRYDRTEEGEIGEWTPESEREVYLERLRATGAFVLTIGLAEVWRDRDTGGVFWRGVPRDLFDAGRHEFVKSTVAENEANLVRIIELLRSVNPGAPIVLTLSPVPLLATFGPTSCISADCVSKSILRVAIDGTLAHGLDGVTYWPSFEVVRWAGAHASWRAYGDHDGQPRHPSRFLVTAIIDAFVDTYYTPSAREDLRARAAALRESANGTLARRLSRAFARRVGHAGARAPAAG